MGFQRPSDPSLWWLHDRAREQVRRLQERLLQQIEAGAKECAEVERQLGGGTTRELETIIKLHNALILRCSLEVENAKELVQMTRHVMQPLLGLARLEEKRRERDEAQAAQRKDEQADGLRPETLEKIDGNLNLL